MASRNAPLSYEASKCVLQYLPVENRLTIRLRCPALRTADIVTPLRIDTLCIEHHSLRFDNIEFILACQKINIDGVVRSYGIDEISIINYRQKIIDAVDLGGIRGMETMQKMLMNKLLGGRRTPVIIDYFEVKGIKDRRYEMEQNLHLPMDLKMKVKDLELNEINDQILQQLSSQIIGPLRTFKLMYIGNPSDQALNLPLIQNARRFECSLRDALGWSYEVMSVCSQEEIIVNHNNYGHAAITFCNFVNLILTGQESNRKTWTNISIDTDEACKSNVLTQLLHQGRAGTCVAVVDDLDSYQFHNLCVCFPLGPNKELIVYGIPGIKTETILKIKVMPRGTARLIQ